MSIFEETNKDANASEKAKLVLSLEQEIESLEGMLVSAKSRLASAKSATKVSGQYPEQIIK